MESLPYFLDFEASGLGHDSYPIEVAFSDGNGDLTSWLIDPRSVSYWQSWDPAAEAVHGISQAELYERGLPAHYVASELNCRLHNRTVFCDGGAFDQFWLFRLFQGAHSRPTFRLDDVADLLRRHLPVEELDRIHATVHQYAPKTHRAAVDVLHLQSLYRAVLVRASCQYTKTSSAFQSSAQHQTDEVAAPLDNLLPLDPTPFRVRLP